MANREGTHRGRYQGLSIQPKVLYIRYWGTFRTTWGRNRVEIMMLNRMSRPLNLKRLKP